MVQGEVPDPLTVFAHENVASEQVTFRMPRSVAMSVESSLTNVYKSREGSALVPRLKGEWVTFPSWLLLHLCFMFNDRQCLSRGNI